ncbi:MAG TPA: cupin domain-containing protein [Stellaceae bacterium]|jgi:gentisate 1,2-dioxygenase
MADAREAMERLNAEAGRHHIWLRTQANAPAQRPWFRDTAIDAEGRVADGRVGANQMKAAAHHWRWGEIGPYLGRIAEIARDAVEGGGASPIEFADRQQFLLVNPGLGGRLQVASTIRCAVSIYNPGDLAPVHMHTPNASRTILSDNGGYTTIEGERCRAERGDLILTPHGTWHDHGNDGPTPVVWADILDFPLLEFLDINWIDEEFPGEREGNARAQKPTLSDGYSARLYGTGGIVPDFVSHRRGIGHDTSPVFHYRGAAIREAFDALKGEAGDPYEGVSIRFVNPATGAAVFPTMDYAAQLLRPGEETRLKRETANEFYIVLAGEGSTEVAGERFDWQENDLFVIPNFRWRRHINRGTGDAVLYSVSDRPLLQKIGQYRAQGRDAGGGVVQLIQ